MGTRRGVPAMNTLPPLPLLSFDPDWEARWEVAHQRHLEIKGVVSSGMFGYFDSGKQERLNEELRATGAALGRLFEAQFRTTDEYRDWRLRFIDAALPWHVSSPLRMPDGLPIQEIRRPLTTARDYAQAQTWRRRYVPSLPERVAKAVRRKRRGDGATAVPFWERAHVRRLLSMPSTAGVIELARALQQAGGDRV